MIPVILCGGSGSRLWPLSRKENPKQFLTLLNQNSLFQETVLRARELTDDQPPVIIAHESYRFLVAEHLRQLGEKNATLLLEPDQKNTAPAIALVALHLAASGNDDLMLILPSDHLITDAAHFKQRIINSIQQAQQNKLITFGIKPTNPNTGYGYIKTGSCLDESKQLFAVSEFIEKPSQSIANTLVQSADCYWNSGMFLFKPSAYLQQLEIHAPEIFNVCKKAITKIKLDNDFSRVNSDEYKNCPSISIDYAIMEKTSEAVVAPYDGEWNDIGTWSQLAEAKQHDEQNNIIEGDILTKDVRNCFIQSNSRLLTVLGIEDSVIIETSDAVLVTHKKYSEQVKDIVEQLQRDNRPEGVSHQKVYRPWGSFETLLNGEQFKVKLLTIKPGASISLQYHLQRSEHWVVVKGHAKVTKGEQSFVLSENESNYTPRGVHHRLENPGETPLKIIEVQLGEYLGEDDIVRLQDHYNREVETE